MIEVAPTVQFQMTVCALAVDWSIGTYSLLLTVIIPFEEPFQLDDLTYPVSACEQLMQCCASFCVLSVGQET